MQRRQKKSNKKGMRRSNQDEISHPKPIGKALLFRPSLKLRFATTGSYTGSITSQNLLDTVNVAMTSIANSDLYYAVRVKKIEIWSVGLQNGINEVTAWFDGTNNNSIGSQRVHTSTSLGVQPAHLVLRPSKDELASMWQVSTNGQNLFYLNLPAICVVEVTLDFSNPIAGNSVLCQFGGTGLTPGAVYVRGLDGKAVGSSTFVPVGYIAIN